MAKCEIGGCRKSRYRTRMMTMKVTNQTSERSVRLCKSHFKEFSAKKEIPISGMLGGGEVKGTISLGGKA